VVRLKVLTHGQARHPARPGHANRRVYTKPPSCANRTNRGTSIKQPNAVLAAGFDLVDAATVFVTSSTFPSPNKTTLLARRNKIDSRNGRPRRGPAPVAAALFSDAERTSDKFRRLVSTISRLPALPDGDLFQRRFNIFGIPFASNETLRNDLQS